MLEIFRHEHHKLKHCMSLGLPVEVDGNTRLRQTKILKEKSDA